MDNEKSALIEKIVFSVLPILFSCVVYLISSLNDVNEKLTTLDNKVSVVVTPENSPRPIPSAELAREKLRQDFMIEQNDSLIRHTENKGELELLKWRIGLLEKKS